MPFQGQSSYVLKKEPTVHMTASILHSALFFLLLAISDTWHCDKRRLIGQNLHRHWTKDNPNAEINLSKSTFSPISIFYIETWYFVFNFGCILLLSVSLPNQKHSVILYLPREALWGTEFWWEYSDFSAATKPCDNSSPPPSPLGTHWYCQHAMQHAISCYFSPATKTCNSTSAKYTQHTYCPQFAMLCIPSSTSKQFLQENRASYESVSLLLKGYMSSLLGKLCLDDLAWRGYILSNDELNAHSQSLHSK